MIIVIIFFLYKYAFYYFFFSRSGKTNHYASRFLGFSLYVSNTTNKSDGILCFQDNIFTLSTIPAVFNTICPVQGQYVIYYNERSPNKTYPDEYSTYAYNELCEVEVIGENIIIQIYLKNWTVLLYGHDSKHLVLIC